MQKYSIPVMWSLSGNIIVEAENLEEAIELAYNADLPNVSQYVDDSFIVNVDGMADHELIIDQPSYRIK